MLGGVYIRSLSFLQRFRITQAMSLVHRLEALRDIKAAATRTIKTLETAAVQEMELFEHTVRYQDILSQTNKATDHAEEISQVATSMYDKSHARKRALDLAKTNREKKLKRLMEKYAPRAVGSSSSASTDTALVAIPLPDVQPYTEVNMPDIPNTAGTEVDPESSMNSDSD